MIPYLFLFATVFTGGERFTLCIGGNVIDFRIRQGYFQCRAWQSAVQLSKLSRMRLAALKPTVR